MQFILSSPLNPAYIRPAAVHRRHLRLSGLVPQFLADSVRIGNFAHTIKFLRRISHRWFQQNVIMNENFTLVSVALNFWPTQCIPYLFTYFIYYYCLSYLSCQLAYCSISSYQGRKITCRFYHSLHFGNRQCTFYALCILLRNQIAQACLYFNRLTSLNFYTIITILIDIFIAFMHQTASTFMFAVRKLHFSRPRRERINKRLGVFGLVVLTLYTLPTPLVRIFTPVYFFGSKINHHYIA